MRYRSILLFGPPGSGKGTQGGIISAIPGFFHSATGDIFRSLDLASEVGRTAWEYASRGDLVPDEFTVKVWRDFIRGCEMTNRYHPETQLLVLDGIPRTIAQAKLLQDTIDVRAIIYLRADKEKMVERLRRRALKENRVDDASDDVIRERLEIFERQTRPLVDFYSPELTHHVDATQSQLRVLDDIIQILIPLKDEIDRENRALERERQAKAQPHAPALAKT